MSGRSPDRRAAVRCTAGGHNVTADEHIFDQAPVNVGFVASRYPMPFRHPSVHRCQQRPRTACHVPHPQAGYHPRVGPIHVETTDREFRQKHC